MSREGTPLWKDPWLAASLLLWAAGLAGICLLLWPQWCSSPELAHGFLMPPALLLLLKNALAERPLPLPLGVVTQRWLCAGLGLLALLATGFGLLYALVFGWSHALACSPLVLAFCCLGLLLLLGLASTGRLAFSWPAFCAATLWLLCTPIPPGTYARLSLALQLAVTEMVMKALDLLGVAAVRHGNVIELLRGSVGVEEACSGIRSLVTCLFAAVLLSAARRMRPWRRALLIALAPLLAWCLNLCRSLVLALLTASDGRLSQGLHDSLGYLALLLATAILAWLAFRLEEKEPKVSKAEEPQAPATARLSSRFLALCCVPACTLAAASLLLPHQRAGSPAAAPALEQWLVAEAPGWQIRNGNLAEEVRRVLLSPTVLQREYLQHNGDATTDLVLYTAYWEPGRASPSFVALHTPEVCWPGAGWTELPGQADDADPLLALAEHRRFRHESGYVQEVWYWHLDGNQALRGLRPYEPLRLIRNALHQGFAPPRPQLFVRISSNRPWAEIRDTEPVRKLLSSSGISGLSTKP